MRQIKVVIASIYPLPLVEERPGYSPQSVFKLPAAAPGEVQYLEIGDCEISDYAGYGKSTMRGDTTTAEKVSADLLRCWTQGFPGVPDSAKASPGIMIIAGDTATAEELAIMESKQREFARICIMNADLNHGKNRPDLITKRDHALAAWLKVTGRPWQERLDRSAIKACPFCGAQNVAEASKCANCREVIDRVRYDAVLAAIKDGRADDVQAAMQRVHNAGELTVESLSQQDVAKMLEEEGIKVGGRRK
jgi:hypothetical protein